MKKTLTVILLMLSVATAHSQNAYYEAQYLSTLSVRDLTNILAAAVPARPAVNLSEQEEMTVRSYITFLQTPFADNLNLDLALLKSAVKKYNDYLALEVSSARTGLGVSHFAPVGATSALSFVSSMIGGNTALSSDQQTMIIDGITKYYAEEFRKAQLLTYLQVFKEVMDKRGELQVLFPQTYLKLKNTEPSKFPELGDEFKMVFNEDLKALIPNLESHIDNHTAAINPTLESKLTWLNELHINAIKANEYYGIVKITADIGDKLLSNYHPVELFNYLDGKYYDPSLGGSNLNASSKIEFIIHGLNLVQRNLIDSAKNKDQKTGNIWIGLQELKKLDTQNKWIYFAGLLRYQDPTFFDSYLVNVSGRTTMTTSNAGILTIPEKAIISKRINTIAAALGELAAFRANMRTDSLKSNFLGYMNLVIKTVENGNFVSGQTVSQPQFQKYLRLSGYVLGSYENIRRKDYSNSIYYIVQILDDLFIKDPAYTDLMNKLDKYGTFMTDVVNSKNSDQVKEVIKKNVAPPSSFILKREYARTFSITGQPGYFVSVEKLTGGDKKAAFVSGITLPLGFEFTFKSKTGNENSGSFGIFAQLIDLGAVLNFRVSDETSDLPDKIEFKQIFSPGGSFNYGFKNSPVTIGVGYQYTPQLRSVTLASGNKLYPNGNRIFFRLAWDIPFINIVKSKSK